MIYDHKFLRKLHYEECCMQNLKLAQAKKNVPSWKYNINLFDLHRKMKDF